MCPPPIFNLKPNFAFSALFWPISALRLKMQIFQIFVSKTPHFSRKFLSVDPYFFFFFFFNPCGTHPPTHKQKKNNNNNWVSPGFNPPPPPMSPLWKLNKEVESFPVLRFDKEKIPIRNESSVEFGQAPWNNVHEVDFHFTAYKRSWRKCAKNNTTNCQTFHCNEPVVN